jgi:hypothetical protein
VQPSEQVAHDGELLGTIGKRDTFDEPGHQDGASVEVRDRVVDRKTLRGKVVPLQESQDAGVTLDAGPRTGGRERTRDPRVAVEPVDAEDVGLVHTDLRRRLRIDAVATSKVGEQSLGNGLVVHAGAETLEIAQRFGVALARLRGVPPDDLLEVAVPGHDKPPLDTLVPQ